MGGAFQTSRDIFQNPIWQDVPKFRIFFFIVGNAVFSEDGVRMGDVLIKRGQFLRSYRNLSDDLYYLENRKVKKYSISVISRKIESLVKEERLKIEDTELGTLFTVVNYDEYQRLENYKRKLGTELEQGWNRDGTELEHSGNNNKKVNKVKKVKDNTNDDLFKTFWDKYPKKVGVANARKKFDTLIKQDGMYEKIMKGLDGYLLTINKNGTEKKYMKQGDTFLNQQNFLDYLTIEEPSKPKREEGVLYNEDAIF